jgi:hypothetical protein
MSTEDLNKTNVIIQTEGERYGEQIHTQVSSSDLSNGIISVWNIDYQGRPTSWRIHNERQQISSTHFTIQLIQIPDDTQNMTIYVEDPNTGDYRELNQVYNYDELVKPDTYYVHYANGIVKFNQNLSGLNVVASYYGKGVMYISDSRIFHNKAGSVVDTLDNILNRAEDGLKLVEQAGGLANTLNEIEYKTEQGKKVIGQIEDTIHSAQMFGCMVDFTKQSFVLKAEKDADGNFRVSSKEMASVFAQLVAYKGGEPMVGLEIVTEDGNDKDVEGNLNVYQNNCSISFKNNALSLNSIIDPILGRAMARVRIDIPKSQLFVQDDAIGVLSIYKDFEFSIVMNGEDLYNLELSTPMYGFRGNYDGFIYETQQVEIDFTLTKANTTIDIKELTYQSSSNSKLVIEKLSNSKVRITANKDIDKEKPTVPSNGMIIFNASGGGSSVTKNFVYSVIKEGKSAKMLFLTGEQVLTYNNPTCTGYPNKTTLDLKAVTQNLEGQNNVRWYFLNSIGNPVSLVNGVNATIGSDGLTCSIQCWDFNEEGTPIPDQNLNPWQGRRSVTIRAMVDSETYDEITLYKMGTGQDGQSSFNVILTNETTSLTLDNNMNIIDNISNVFTDILCYSGTEKISPELVNFSIAELHECAIKHNGVFIADNGEARIQLSNIIEDPDEIETSKICLSLENGDCFELESSTENVEFDSNHTDDFEVESDSRFAVITNDTSYVDVDVTYNGVTIRKRFTISKSIQGANGDTGEKGDSLIIDVTGGTRTITYSQVNTKPRPEYSNTFYAKLYNNGIEVDESLVAYTWKANGHVQGSGYGSYFTPSISPTMDESIGTNEVIVEATYKTQATVNGVSKTVFQTLHYYIPIVVTRDANGLDWVNEWEGTKTLIEDHAVFTPKIFAGSKDEHGRISGVAIGCDFMNDQHSKGLAGYQEDEISFLLDTDGSFMVGNPFKDNGIGMYYSKGNLTINVTDMAISGSTVPTEESVNNALSGAIQGVKDEFSQNVSDLQSQIDNIDIVIEETLGDGYLTVQEKAKVEAVLLSLRNEYEAVINQVSKILTNAHLTNEVVIEKVNNSLSVYNTKFTALETSINNILGSTDKQIPPAMTSAFNTTLNDFKEATKNIKEVINEALININQQYSDEVIQNAKNEIQTEVDDVSNALTNLETTMNGEFKSGLISQAKIKALLQHVEIINNELADITAQFNNMIASTNLSSNKKARLTELKGILDTANATLQASIEMSIPDYLFTEAEISTIKSNISKYETALQNYNVYAQECNTDIALNIAQGVVDAISDEEIFNKVTNEGIKQGLFIKDGLLFINGQYIQSYNFKAVRKSDGATTFLIDSNGNIEITPSKLTITTSTDTNIATKDDVDSSIKENLGYNIILDNDNQTIPTDKDLYPLENKSYTVNVSAYKGATEVNATIGAIETPTGITSSVSGQTITFSVSAVTRFTSTSGVITIPVTVGTTLFNKSFSWSLSVQSIGEDAKVCKIVADNQVFISVDKKTYTPSIITLKPLLQHVTFSKWQYTINGETRDVVSGQQGLAIDTSKNLIISNTTSLLDTSSTAIFKLITSDSNVYDTFTVAKISDGVDGKDGINGINGKDGKDGTSVTIKGSYTMAEWSNVQSSLIPSAVNGDGYIVDGYLYVFDGSKFINVGQIKGDKGDSGADGKSSYLHIKYSNDGATFTSNNGEAIGTYIGTYVDYIEADSNVFSDYTWKRYVGTDGIDGANGKDALTILLTNESQSFITDSSRKATSTQTYTTDILVYKGTSSYTFTNDLTTITLNGITAKKVSNSQVSFTVSSGTTISLDSGTFTIPIVVDGITYNKVFSWSCAKAGIQGNAGNDGKGISSIVNKYLASNSSSGVTTETSGWTTTVQSTSKDKRYLWNYETITYTDNTTLNTTPCIIGTYGETGATGNTGNGISSITEYYLATSSSTGVTTSTSGWSTTIQTPTSDKKYLWNYEKITYTNGTNYVGTPRIIGNYAENGADGVDALSLDLSANTQVIRSNDGGDTFYPSNIRVTATCQNTSVNKWYISKDGGSNFVELTSSVGTNYVDITLSDFTSRDTDTLVVKCVSLTESVFDTITLQKLIDVADLKVGNRNLAQKTSDSWDSYNSFHNKENECIFNYDVLVKDINVGDTVSVFCKVKYKNIVMGEQGSSTPRITWQGSGNVTGWDSVGRFCNVPVSLVPNQVGEIETVASATFKANAEHLKNSIWYTDWRVDYIESGEISIACMMVVNGKLPTGWIPAPEDMPSLIDNTVASFLERNNEIMNEIYTITKDDYITPSERESLKMLFRQATSQYESITRTIQKMSNGSLNVNITELDNAFTSLTNLCRTILDDNLTTGAVQLRNAMVEFYNAYNNALFAISSYTKDELTRITATLTQHEDSIEMSVKRTDPDYNSTLELGKHMKFSDGWLELYATINGEEGQFKTILSNEKLAFTDSGEEVASISNQSLNINKAEIKNKLTVGNVTISPSANGGIVFSYNG